MLKRVYPEQPPRWYNRLHKRVDAFAKYVGMPALLLAAVVPVYNMFSALAEYNKKEMLNAAYSEYITELLASGETSRAEALLKDLQDADKQSTTLRYLKAKTVALAAILRGLDHESAEDTINVLLRLNRKWPRFSHGATREREMSELELSLIDIDLLLQRYEIANRRLAALEESPELSALPLGAAHIRLRRGVMAVLQHQYAAAGAELEQALKQFRGAGDQSLIAECEFNLGKVNQFSSQYNVASVHYEAAKHIYESRNDRLGSLRTYNNMAMMAFDVGDLEQSKYLYSLEESLAREVGDERGLARALVNITLILGKEGRFDEGIAYALEAEEIFKKQRNRLGLANAQISLARLNHSKHELDRALHFVKQATIGFLAVKDVAGLAEAFGLTGELTYEKGEQRAAIYYFVSAAILHRHMRDDQIPEYAHNLGVFGHKVREFGDVIGPDALQKEMADAALRLAAYLKAGGIGHVDASAPVDFPSKE